MNFIIKLFHNRVLITCLTAWFIAQVIKLILTYCTSKKIDFTRLVGSGGMPSSHTAFVMALSTAIGKLYGWDSAFFAVAITFSFIVMYDAAGVRRAAGHQAKILNIIIEDLANNRPLGNEKLKELLGHTPKEVVAGAILGILMANLMI